MLLEESSSARKAGGRIFFHRSEAELLAKRAEEIEKEEIRERQGSRRWSLGRLLGEGKKNLAEQRSVVREELRGVEVPGQSAGAYLERARVHMRNEDYDRAAENYERAITLGEDGAEVRYDLGMAYEKQAERLEASGEREEALKKYRDAVSEYKKVLWQESHHAYALYSLGCVYARLDEREDALYYFRKTLESVDSKSELARRARYDIRLLGGY